MPVVRASFSVTLTYDVPDGVELADAVGASGSLHPDDLPCEWYVRYGTLRFVDTSGAWRTVEARDPVLECNDLKRPIEVSLIRDEASSDPR